MAAVAHEGAAVSRDLAAAAASWTRLFGRAFVTRSVRGKLRGLLEAAVPAVEIEGGGEDD